VLTGGSAVAGKWWTLLTVCLGMLILLIDITTVNVAPAAHRHA
jgi:hypothetical protein